MAYIKGTNISFEYQGQIEKLFEGINFEINKGDKIGLVGKNGCGKTTLFKMILGDLPVSFGSFYRKENLRIGYLPQEIIFLETWKVKNYLWDAKPFIANLKRKLDAITDFTDSENLQIYSEFEGKGGYQFEVIFDKALSEFDMSEKFLSRTISTLSGGEKTKIALCQIILKEPDLLFLDEPTNHLDIETLTWLEQYLENLNIPFVVISHDRKFLDNCVNCIWEMENKTLREYGGNYSLYKHEKDEEFNRKMQEYQIQQKKVRQLTKVAQQRRDWAHTFQAETRPGGYAPKFEEITNSAKKAMKRAKNVEKRLDMMIQREEGKKPFIEKERKISLGYSHLRNRFVLRIENLTKKFGENLIFEKLNLAVENGECIAITGKNGSGKTTLLKILMGKINGYSGEYSWAPQAKIGYYAQEFEHLDFKKTIIDEVLQGKTDKETQTEARTILGCLNIRGDKAYQNIHSLSIGERSKVALTKIILSDANILMLDEPTNHLEITAKEALEDALLQFNGTIIFVSHDRYLQEKLATKTFDMDLV